MPFIASGCSCVCSITLSPRLLLPPVCVQLLNKSSVASRLPRTLVAKISGCARLSLYTTVTNTDKKDGRHAAGVWEDSRYAYLHEVLVRRCGISSALCILFYDVLRHLFLSGAVDFAVRVDCRSFESFPTAEPLTLPRASLITPEGGLLNTCTLAALEETLRHLKRAYWPCMWDTSLDCPVEGGVGSQGGFRCALPPL
jgi:hypothetical protein